jgi:hypothetical protein
MHTLSIAAIQLAGRLLSERNAKTVIGTLLAATYSPAWSCQLVRTGTLGGMAA